MVTRIAAGRAPLWTCLVIASAVTCGPAGEQAGDMSSVTILYPYGDERIVGPIWAADARFLVFLPLVEFDERGEPEGRLAQRWSHSPDFREWTFHVSQGVRWHDGAPVTARDIAFSLDLYKHPAMAWDALLEAYRVRVPDDSTLTITYPKPPRDPFHDWKVFWPKHLLERLDPNQITSWDFWVHPVGNGPYRYVRHVPKTMLELEANPDFFGGKPRIERVILKFAGGTPIAELLSGNVDVVENFNQADLPIIAADRRFHAYYGVQPVGLRAIFWNHRSPFFSSEMVRRVLTLGIDRNDLTRTLNLPEDLPIVDVIFTSRQWRRYELPEPLPYDPDSAAWLLDAAGWRDDDGDGVRERGGQAFHFVALAPPGGTPMLEQRAAVYVQAQLRRIGIRMDLQTLDVSVLSRRLRAGEFEAAFYPFFNQLKGHVEWLGEGSPIGYTNSRVIGLLRAVQATTDPDEIDRIYRRLMPVVRADLPVTFLFPEVHTFVAHRRIRGLRSPDRANPVMRMEHLWLQDER